MKTIDFRSDTITHPTAEMRSAIYEAVIGDDVYKEDATINQLELLTAEVMKKEAAIFVPSGTMGNLISVLVHTQSHRGSQIILDARSHILTSEAGGLSTYAGVLPKSIYFEHGIYTAKKIEEALVLDHDIHHAQSKLICLENSHNFAGGTVTPLHHMKQIFELSKENNLFVHIDGARIFNAATYLNCPVSEIAQYSDSIMFCLSKGLAAPVGSMIAGSADFIEKAIAVRKSLGGGMRQGGFLAAAGILALTKMTKRLDEDHETAKILGKQLNEIEGFCVDLDMLHTNIVMVNLTKEKLTAESVVSRLKEHGIFISKISKKQVRFVTHYHLSKTDINETMNRIRNLEF